MWYLRDPLALTSYQVIMPQALAQIIPFCDGNFSPTQIHAAFCQQIGETVDYAIITDTLTQLDEACLLENERSQHAKQAQLEAYRAQPHRAAALAGVSYPKNPAELSRFLDSYSADDDLSEWEGWDGRAIISPHIDYQRGGPVYAKVWTRAEKAILDADLILMFGTDHKGGLGTFTLTRQAYATPYGVIPTDLNLVDALEKAIGPDVYEEELHHREEHSIELSAVWLHHIYQKAGMEPKPMVPVLCGSFHQFVRDGSHPAQDELLMTAVDTLRRETKGKKVLAIASVDFAHVGPSFGGDFMMDDLRCQIIRQTDADLVTAVANGDAASFYQQIADIQDRNNVCGFSSIYLMLRYLGDDADLNGQLIAYDQCPAEPDSIVSIASMLID